MEKHELAPKCQVISSWQDAALHLCSLTSLRNEGE